MSNRPVRILSRAALSTVVLCLAFSATGCGRKTATITGKVTFKGQPLNGGVVAFLSTDGSAASGLIDPDGMYTVAKVHVGEAKVTVQSMPTPPMMVNPMTVKPKPAGAAEDSDEAGELPYVRIPERYLDKNKSGLSYTVQEGEQEFNIPLKP